MSLVIVPVLLSWMGFFLPFSNRKRKSYDDLYTNKRDYKVLTIVQCLFCWAGGLVSCVHIVDTYCHIYLCEATKSIDET